LNLAKDLVIGAGLVLIAVEAQGTRQGEKREHALLSILVDKPNEMIRWEWNLLLLAVLHDALDHPLLESTHLVRLRLRREHCETVEDSSVPHGKSKKNTSFCPPHQNNLCTDFSTLLRPATSQQQK
jgi:hypothetical protein